MMETPRGSMSGLMGCVRWEVFIEQREEQHMVMKAFRIGLMTLAFGFGVACSAPQKPDVPVGKPPGEEEKHIPKDSTDEDTQPNSQRLMKQAETPSAG